MLSSLATLPLELLLEIVVFLSAHWSPRASRDVISLSRVNHRLRQLCLLPLFSYLKYTRSGQLRRLRNKSMSDPGFAKLIRTLDLGRLRFDPEHQLLDIIPRLESLSSIVIDGAILDGQLLTIINCHPTLRTAAVRDTRLRWLKRFPDATRSVFSKLCITSVNMETSLFNIMSQSPARELISTGGLRIKHLLVPHESLFTRGLETWQFRGLENVGFLMCQHSQIWLSEFVRLHPGLRTIKLHTIVGFKPWCRSPSIPYSATILDALDADGLQQAVALDGLVISRTPTSSSVDDWEVTELHLDLTSSLLDVLRLTSRFYPTVTSLILNLRFYDQRTKIHIDDLLDVVSRFPLLRRLELLKAHKHLSYGGQTPWDAACESDTVARQSGCVTASAAMRWFLTRIAQRVSSLDMIKHSDEGSDWDGPNPKYNGRYMWRVDALYGVDGPELIGRAKLKPSSYSEDWN